FVAAKVMVVLICTKWNDEKIISNSVEYCRKAPPWLCPHSRTQPPQSAESTPDRSSSPLPLYKCRWLRCPSPNTHPHWERNTRKDSYRPKMHRSIQRDPLGRNIR